MVRFFIIACMALLAHSTSAQQSIRWMTWEEAIAAHSQNQKPVFVDVYTNWCGWCKHMDKNTFTDSVVVAYMNEHYNAVKLNAERTDTVMFNGQAFVNENKNSGRKGAHQLAIALLDGKMSYPSYAFIGNPWNKTVAPGYMAPRDFERVIRYFVEGAPVGLTYDQFSQNYKPLSD